MATPCISGVAIAWSADSRLGHGGKAIDRLGPDGLESRLAGFDIHLSF